MYRKLVIFLFLLLLFGTGVLGAYYYVKSQDKMLVDEVPIPTSETVSASPTPIFEPFTEKIKEINEQFIIVTGEDGDVTFPNDPKMVAVYKRALDAKEPEALPLSVLKVGMQVEVRIIVPGEKVELVVDGNSF